MPVLYHWSLRGDLQTDKIRGKWVIAAAALILLSVAGGAISLLRKPAPPPKPAAAATPAVSPGSEVSFTGTVEAREVVLVPAPIEGTLETIEVEPGTEVFEGQLLARIKNEGLESSKQAAQELLERTEQRVSDLESAIIAGRLEASRASADAVRTRAEQDRTEKIAQRQLLLQREGATARLTFEKSQKDFASAKADYEAAREVARQAEDRVAAAVRDLEAAKRILDERKAALDASDADLKAAEVNSPVDGVLLAARARAGDSIDPGMQDLFQIAIETQKLKVVVEPDPKVLARMKSGLPALISIAELGGEMLPGEVSEVADGKVTVLFESASPDVKPKLSAVVRIQLP